MKIILLLALVAFASASDPFRILQSLRVLSAECKFHGYYYKNECFCKPEWQGPTCELPRAIGYSDLASTKCDDILSRLDFLTNISPENYNGDDYEFSRFKKSSVGEGDAAYGAKSYDWIEMHKVTPKFEIFGGVFQATDIHQGSLGNCYLLAALASMSIHKNGQYIQDVFITKEDNSKHVYVTRWLIAGKPRFVAVDDWVPGSGNRPSFSGVTADNDYWAMIIEKSWAKIHGEYMITEGGIQTNVWKSLTQAPIFTYNINSQTRADELYNLIADKIAKFYPTGAASGQKGQTQDVEGHAYSILGAYTINYNGLPVKLIKVYNPWNKETWATNPWGDNSEVWTPALRAQVGGVPQADDGIYFVEINDFKNNYVLVNWAEVNPNYETSFIDVPVNTNSARQTTEYSVNLKISGLAGQKSYVYIDLPDSRLFNSDRNCQPFSLYSYYAKSSTGQIIQASNNGQYVVELTADGDYTFNFKVSVTQAWNKYVTVSAYAPKGKFSFTSKFNKVQEKDCSALRNCNGRGKCNYNTGSCSCFLGFGGADCSQTAVVQCPSNCNGNGKCDTSTGICTCNPGFTAANCVPCQNTPGKTCEVLGTSGCQKGHGNFPYAQAYCQQYCGKLGVSEGFGSCYIPRDPNRPCDYVEDQYSNCSTELSDYCHEADIKEGCKKTCCGK